MKERKLRVGAMDIALLALCLCLTLGVALVFHPCAAREDGGWMTCHWAGRGVLGIGAALSALAVARLFMGPGAKLGADVAMVAFAALAAVLPGGLIGLCVMNTMRCHTVTRPAVGVVCGLIAVAAAADGLLQRRRSRDTGARGEGVV